MAGNLQANQPSSSSRRVRAGKGAPGASPSPSVVGSRTKPSLLKGLSFCSVPTMGFCRFVLTGCSRRAHPKLFMLSLNDAVAMAAEGVVALSCSGAGAFEWRADSWSSQVSTSLQTLAGQARWWAVDKVGIVLPVSSRIR